VLVNDAVKALQKKRKHQTVQSLLVSLSKTSLLKRQAVWYSSFIAAYIWFMYWIAQDFFVWHKPFSEVNPVNYVGSIAAIVFIWAGPKILKPNRTQMATSEQILLPRQSVQQPAITAPKSKPQQPPQKTAPANSRCAHYLGYLNQRQNSQEIPSECFTCEHVIKCMGSKN
jgi:hypothetical protein